MGQRGGVAGRNLSVFVLHNARASLVADTLTRIYRTTPAGRRGGTAAGSIVVIPDERLNALIVHANRSDRPTIENLVKMLDVADVPESVTVTRMKIIPVKNTSAAGVAQVLGNVFKNYVDSIGVEENTNSLVVMGPTPMTEEISRFVTVLDEAAGGDPAKTLRIIPLHKTNALRMRTSLDSIMGTSATRSRSAATPSMRLTTGSSTTTSSSSGTSSSPSTTTTSPPTSTISPSTAIPRSISTMPSSSTTRGGTAAPAGPRPAPKPAARPYGY